MTEGDEQKKQDPRPGGGRIDGEIRMVPRGAPNDPNAVDLDMSEEQNQDDGSVPFGVDVVQFARDQERKRQNDLERAAAEDQKRAAEEDRKKAQTPSQQASATPEANPYSPAKQRMDALQKPQQNQPSSPQNETPAQSPNRVSFGNDENQAARDKAKLQDQAYANKTREALSSAWKNLKDKFTKDTVKAYLKALFYSEAGPIIIGIIVLLLALGLVGYGYYMYHSGANGTTPTQAVNSIDNKSLLEKLNLLAGDKDTQKQLSTEVMTEAQKNLTALKDSTTNADTKNKIDKALADITKYLATPSPDLGKSIIEQVKAIIIAYTSDPSVTPILTGKSTHLPVDQNVVDGVAKSKPGNWANANIDHGWTIRNHNEVLYDGRGHGTYLHPGSSWSTSAGLPTDLWGDALDIPAGGATVYAPFNGTIIKAGGGGENPILIKSKDDPQTFAVMGNVDGHPSSGDVTAGQKLGTISNHLHFELWINNRPVTSGATFNKPQFWLKIKTALKIN